MGKRHNLTVRIICLLLCCLIMTVLFPLCTEATVQNQTVRVGFFKFDGYHMQDADEYRSGYGYDILQHLIGYTDWKIEYVGYDKSWSDMQDMLENGEIDILTSAQKTDERENRFDFSDEPIGTSAVILTVKAGDNRYPQSDYANWNGMRIGMITGSSRNDDFAEFANEKGFNFIPVYYDSTSQAAADLKKGSRIDAIVSSNLRSIDGEWILSQFDSSPFYAMTRKGNAALMAQINHAISCLNNDEPEIFTHLMKMYYTPENGDEISFTQEERLFLDQMKNVTFTAIINPDRAPFSYMENGELTGILYDIAQEVIVRSGLNIEFAHPQSRSEYMMLAQSGDIDIRFDTSNNFNTAESLGYRLTNSYIDVSIAKLHRHDSNTIGNVALLKDSDVANLCKQLSVETYGDVVYYDSTVEMIEAILSGKQQTAYMYRRCADLAVYNDETNQLVVDDVYGLETSFTIGVSSRQNPILYSILKKTVASINDKIISDICYKYAVFSEKPFSLIGYMYDYPLHIIILLFIVFIVILLSVIVILLLKKRKYDVKKLNDEKVRNALLADALSTAEKADFTKSQFLSRVSHEMRTPLNAIIGFIELSKDADQQQVSSYLANSDIAAKQLLSVINDVLDMSSIESGKLKLAHTPFDIKQMICAITSMYQPICRQKGLEYETRILNMTDEWLIGDQLRINQILMNLLGNAVKFTSHGHILLEISQYDATDNNIFTRLKVSDTGCGMSNEMKSRLFKPFEQESAATARKYGGSGLGLSIVKSLVTMMDGAICVESAVERGTSFTVDLPFTKCNIKNKAILPDDIAKMRVLAVDDEESERQYLSIVLERIGLRYVCAQNGNDALQELDKANMRNDPFNICLIDWRMRELSGEETIKSIRRCYGSGIVIIAVSSYEKNQTADNAKEAGADMFITKPLFQSTLNDLFMTLSNGHIKNYTNNQKTLTFEGKRILLAEDNAMNRMVAAGIITRLKIKCDWVENGQIAADTFINSEPGYYDAILMDIQMPVMDGFEATVAIRCSKHPEAKTVQIIALTANAFNEDIARTLSSGMNAHVTKPIEPNMLMLTLEKAFAANENQDDHKQEEACE